MVFYQFLHLALGKWALNYSHNLFEYLNGLLVDYDQWG
jgi:hypothetical protein